MTAYETKKIIYETIVKEIYINPETAHALTGVIYKNLQAAQQSAQADKCPECGAADGYHKTGCDLWLWEPSPRRKA